MIGNKSVTKWKTFLCFKLLKSGNAGNILLCVERQEVVKGNSSFEFERKVMLLMSEIIRTSADA